MASSVFAYEPPSSDPLCDGLRDENGIRHFCALNGMAEESLRMICPNIQYGEQIIIHSQSTNIETDYVLGPDLETMVCDGFNWCDAYGSDFVNNYYDPFIIITQDSEHRYCSAQADFFSGLGFYCRQTLEMVSFYSPYTKMQYEKPDISHFTFFKYEVLSSMGNCSNSWPFPLKWWCDAGYYLASDNTCNICDDGTYLGNSETKYEIHSNDTCNACPDHSYTDVNNTNQTAYIITPTCTNDVNCCQISPEFDLSDSTGSYKYSPSCSYQE